MSVAAPRSSSDPAEAVATTSDHICCLPKKVLVGESEPNSGRRGQIAIPWDPLRRETFQRRRAHSVSWLRSWHDACIQIAARISQPQSFQHIIESEEIVGAKGIADSQSLRLRLHRPWDGDKTEWQDRANAGPKLP